ncbi:restriction endonuclease [bacterium]|nr:restriction endonuclease [bacterium]
MAKRAWMVRAGENAFLADQFEEKKIVAIGWLRSDLSGIKTTDELKSLLRQQYPDFTKLQIAISSGQIWRFIHEIEPGDYIMTYLPNSREYLLGKVVGGYEYNPDLIETDEENGGYFSVRRVSKWERIDRDVLSQPARNTLGAIKTLFEITKLLPELIAAVKGEVLVEIPDETIEESTSSFYEDVEARSDELIGDLLARLSGQEFESLVTAVIRAMGYHATQSKTGPDRGVDIIASPDPLHLEQPRIKVQVKKWEGTVGGETMRSFIGTLQAEDKGLFVSFGGYTKDAFYEAERSNRPLTLLDRQSFTKLLLESYEKLNHEFQRKIPLKKIFIPIDEEM